MDTENSYFLIQSILCIVSVPCAAQDTKIFNLQKAENEENCEICRVECFRLLYSLLDVLEKVNLKFVGFTEVCFLFCLIGFFQGS